METPAQFTQGQVVLPWTTGTILSIRKKETETGPSTEAAPLQNSDYIVQ